jgi:hypothetical protein
MPSGPVPTATTWISNVALHPGLAAGGQEVLGRRRWDQRRRVPARPVEAQALQHLPSGALRAFRHQLPLEPEDVEHQQLHGDVASQLRRRRAHVHAALQPLEAGAAGALVEGHDLAVEHRRTTGEAGGQGSQLGVAPGHVVAQPAGDGHAPVVNGDDGADAVPLGFDDPAVEGRRESGGGGQHRRQLRRVHGRLGGRRFYGRITTSRSSVMARTAHCGPSLVLPLSRTPP